MQKIYGAKTLQIEDIWGWVVSTSSKVSATYEKKGMGGCLEGVSTKFNHMFRDFFPDPLPLSGKEQNFCGSAYLR